jgi:hypothetical protein
LQDQLLRPALEAFVYDFRQEMLRQLVQANRALDQQKANVLVGKIEVYETLLKEMEHFAASELERASQ